MRNNMIQDQKRPYHLKNKRLEWLFYLPGAFIISYGLWLLITVS